MVAVVARLLAGRGVVLGAKGVAPLAGLAQVQTRADEPAEEQEADDGADDDARDGAPREVVVVVLDGGVRDDDAVDDGGGGLARVKDASQERREGPRWRERRQRVIYRCHCFLI